MTLPEIDCELPTAETDAFKLDINLDENFDMFSKQMTEQAPAKEVTPAEEPQLERVRLTTESLTIRSPCRRQTICVRTQ
jgi:hypothetical protein